MRSMIRRWFIILLLLVPLCWQRSALPLEEAGSVRNLDDTLTGLKRLLKNGNLTFQEMRDLKEAVARLQSQVQQKSLTEEEQELAAKIKELIEMKAEAEPRDRIAQLTAAKVLSLFGDPLKALEFLRKTRANSAEDIEWPFLACSIFLQLGDYPKAAIYAKTVDRLLSKQTPLSLSAPVHVEQVQSYRLYTPYSGSAPKPGDTMILYIEVDGAKFKVQQLGMYACSLDFSLELRDELQNVIERQDNYGRYAPEYNGPVEDLHATIYYRIPYGLDGGSYSLIITCKDVYGNAIADTDFVFDIGGKKRIKIPEQNTAVTDNRTQTNPELLLEKAKSGDFSDVMDLLDDDLGELGNDPYNLKALSKEELEKNKLKAAEIMLERSKSKGSMLVK